MRVLYVAWRFPKLSETFVSNEVAALIDAGLDVRVISIRAGQEGVPRDLNARIERPCWPAGVVGSGHPWDAGVRDADWKVTALAPLVARGIIRRLASWTPDVVHSPFINRPATVALHLKRMLPAVTTVMMHARDWAVDSPAVVLEGKLRAADGVFAISEATRDGVLAKVADPGLGEKISVVRATPPLSITEVTAEGFPRPTLVTVCRLVEKKGLDILLRAFAQAELQDIDLTVVGDGPERTSLLELSRSLGLSGRVSFVGAASNARARSLMAGATAVVLASREGKDGDVDGIPVVLMEAGQLGVPVISTAAGGIPELVLDGQTGWCVAPGDPASLALALRAAVSDPYEASVRARALSEWVATEFSPKLQARRLIARWERLLK